MKTKCLIVDDEPLSIKLIRNHLSNLDDFIIVGEARNAMDALTILEKNQVDLVFLDINMPKISGIELLKSLQKPPQVIIISAHKEYAIDGFELNVIDYLLKPISFDRFLKAINKYKSFKQNTVTKNIQTNYPEVNNILSIKDNKKVYNIKLNDIQFIESMREYVKFHLDEETIVIKCALSKLEENLPAELFIRIHKSFIIPINKVKVLSATYVEIGKKKIPIGRNYKSFAIKTISNLGFTI
ncbi:MAG: response regulator transcription factor [Bacteroidales bacterium]|nr:response regulator transcription factor [Bacteroidales bacterium]